jgi:hypothetical protein
MLLTYVQFGISINMHNSTIVSVSAMLDVCKLHSEVWQLTQNMGYML